MLDDEFIVLRGPDPGKRLSMPSWPSSLQIASPRKAYLHHARVQISEPIGFSTREQVVMLDAVTSRPCLKDVHGSFAQAASHLVHTEFMKSTDAMMDTS
jgi:hypothetical protein